MLKKIRNNLVESDEGFSVEILGRAGIKYKDQSDAFYVDSEIECGHYDMVIYKKRIREFEAPMRNYEQIDDNKKGEIVENTRRALLYLGYKVEIEDLY